MYDTQQSTGLPDRPALQNWWILMCHHMKMCHETGEKNGNSKIRRDGERKWSKIDPPIYQRRFKVEGKGMFLKIPVFFPVPCTRAAKTSSTESITYFLRAVFWVHAKKRNIKSLLLSFLSIFLPLHLKAAVEGGKGFSYFWRRVRGLDVSALFSGARHFLLQMKTKIHPPGWIINDMHA